MNEQNTMSSVEMTDTSQIAAAPDDASSTLNSQVGDIATLIAAARAIMAGGNPLDALPLWQELRERFPDRADGSVGCAAVLKEAGKLDEAEQILSESIARFPGDLWAWIHYAQVATRRGDWAEALRRWGEIRNQFSDVAAGYVGYAEALKESGRLDEAEDLLAQSIAKFPDEEWAWIHYALVANAKNEWMQALQRWQEVRVRFPQNSMGDAGYAGALKEAAGLRGRVQKLLRLLKPHCAEGVQKARFGSVYDGGYVMIDDFTDIAAAFSFGVGGDVNWDAAVADRGVTVFQFDHTVDGPPTAHPGFKFEKARIVANPAPGAYTIDELVQRYGKGEGSLILKIDIEADEWAVLDSASAESLTCFAQIMGEFHFLKNALIEPNWYELALRMFQKLTDTFALVHVHANNQHGLHNVANLMVPNLVEFTFANRRRYRLSSSGEEFPGPLDAPNNPGLPELILGQFSY